jgi:hypothetical protein
VQAPTRGPSVRSGPSPATDPASSGRRALQPTASPTPRVQPARRADPRAAGRPVASPRGETLLTAGDRPNDDRSTVIFDETLARWIALVAGGVLLVTAILLAAGFWAKRRILKL